MGGGDTDPFSPGEDKMKHGRVCISYRGRGMAGGGDTDPFSPWEDDGHEAWMVELVE